MPAPSASCCSTQYAHIHTWHFASWPIMQGDLWFSVAGHANRIERRVRDSVNGCCGFVNCLEILFTIKWHINLVKSITNRLLGIQIHESNDWYSSWWYHTGPYKQIIKPSRDVQIYQFQPLSVSCFLGLNISYPLFCICSRIFFLKSSWEAIVIFMGISHITAHIFTKQFPLGYFH